MFTHLPAPLAAEYDKTGPAAALTAGVRTRLLSAATTKFKAEHCPTPARLRHYAATVDSLLSNPGFGANLVERLAQHQREYTSAYRGALVSEAIQG